ncbi:winged helix-turn-helix transcriptional regulator [Streptomyces himalayensis]|uniref:Winged helix-turn-helix transcriptional regulator n=1 Tax=Streptomyces himalayensis subsp. himalayensis TaxID=2756131 RepID=A0A7W0DS67_9ACTN|nr:winged helix-turn-helix transcriptional regulator [Streptomyces himalayensis]MBA2950292.1 winged helix-turn-helix transcriptional regulator [Streptomyces himalayensis subsp. himalayensis]
MATTAPPPATPNDLLGVTKTLDLLAPRWSVWVLMTVSSQPLRYAEFKPRLPWLADGQLHPRLRHLTNAGVIERTEYAPRHVTYGLTSRGAALLPVLSVIASWGDTYLEKGLVANKHTGEMEPERIAPAQNIDDTVALIAPRHATPILFSLQARGTATAKTLATEAMPGYGLTAVYKPLERLIDDGLVTASGSGGYQLTASGRALTPIFEAISAWATAPVSETDARRTRGPGAALSQNRSGPWATTPTRHPAPAVPAAASAARPALTTTPPDGPAWKSGDLFSHQIPAHPMSPAGGPRR